MGQVDRRLGQEKTWGLCLDSLFLVLRDIIKEAGPHPHPQSHVLYLHLMLTTCCHHQEQNIGPKHQKFFWLHTIWRIVAYIMSGNMRGLQFTDFQMMNL